MSDTTPVNKNFISPLNFKFILKRAPHVNFFVQKVNIPGLSLPSTESPNPLLRIPIFGDHLDYDDLSVSFKVDEDLQNYLEIHNWLRGVGKQSYEQYDYLSKMPAISGEGLRSEISFTILSSAKRANYEIVFESAYPTSISSINFSSSENDIDYVEAEATFKYLKYEIIKI